MALKRMKSSIYVHFEIFLELKDRKSRVSPFGVMFKDINIVCVYDNVCTIIAIKSGPFSFAGLNVFDSDAGRINSAQPPGVQPPAVWPLGGHGTHDHQSIGAAQNQAVSLFRILVSGHVTEQRWQAEKTGGICRWSRTPLNTGIFFSRFFSLPLSSYTREIDFLIQMNLKLITRVTMLAAWCLVFSVNIKTKRELVNFHNGINHLSYWESKVIKFPLLLHSQGRRLMYFWGTNNGRR